MRKSIAILCLLATTGIACAQADTGPAHLCGGIGKEGRAEMLTHQKDFDLGFWLTEGKTDRYLAAVPITIQRDGTTVASFVSDGPMCYVKLPAGTYTVIGTHKGETRKAEIKTGSFGTFIRW